MKITRREFLKLAGLTTVGVASFGMVGCKGNAAQNMDTAETEGKSTVDAVGHHVAAL